MNLGSYTKIVNQEKNQGNSQVENSTINGGGGAFEHHDNNT